MMIRIFIQYQPIDLAAEMAPVHALRSGAVASFVGTARADGRDGAKVTATELEHYPAMTEAALHALADSAMQRWPLAACLIIHRVGMIPVGDAIVLTAAASAHRADAIECCAFLIDRLKSDAPFWKKEHFDTAPPRWVEAKDSDAARANQWV